MNFEQLKEDLIESAPRGSSKLEQILKYVDEVEYNSKFIASEIYKPQVEIHAYLSAYLDPEEDEWVIPLLKQLKPE